MSEIYISQGGKVYGPFERPKAVELLAAQQIAPQAMARLGEGEWVPAERLLGPRPAATPPKRAAGYTAPPWVQVIDVLAALLALGGAAALGLGFLGILGSRDWLPLGVAALGAAPVAYVLARLGDLLAQVAHDAEASRAAQEATLQLLRERLRP